MGAAPTRQAALTAAVQALRRGETQSAESEIDAVLAQWPDYAEAKHFLGVLRHEQVRISEALALIGAVVLAQPAHGGAWNNLGNVLLSVGRADDALEAYQRAAQAAEGQPSTAAPLANLSRILRHQGRWAEAEAEASCRQALALAPEFAEAWFNLSLVLMNCGRINEGLLANSHAIALWPQRRNAPGRTDALPEHAAGALRRSRERRHAGLLRRPARAAGGRCARAAAAGLAGLHRRSVGRRRRDRIDSRSPRPPAASQRPLRPQPRACAGCRGCRWIGDRPH